MGRKKGNISRKVRGLTLRLIEIFQEHEGEETTLSQICIWLDIDPNDRQRYHKIYYLIKRNRDIANEFWKPIEKVFLDGDYKDLNLDINQQYKLFIKMIKRLQIPYLFYNPEQHRYFIPETHLAKEELNQINITKKVVGLFTKLKEMGYFEEEKKLIMKSEDLNKFKEEIKKLESKKKEDEENE